MPLPIHPSNPIITTTSNLQQQKKNVFACCGIYYLILGGHLDGLWPILLSFIFLRFFFLRCFQLFFIIVIYYQINILISFWSKWRLNLKFFLQSSETLLIKLTKTYHSFYTELQPIRAFNGTIYKFHNILYIFILDIDCDPQNHIHISLMWKWY